MQSFASTKALFGLFGVRYFIVRQSEAAFCQCRYRCDDTQLRAIVSPERTKAVTSFYSEPAVDQAAAKVSVVVVVVDIILLPCELR